MEKIILHDIDGIARKSGIDQNGNAWTEFFVDAFAGQEWGDCAICGNNIGSGWMCLDGGDEVCDSHVEYAEDSANE